MFKTHIPAHSAHFAHYFSKKRKRDTGENIYIPYTRIGAYGCSGFLYVFWECFCFLSNIVGKVGRVATSGQRPGPEASYV